MKTIMTMNRYILTALSACLCIFALSSCNLDPEIELNLTEEDMIHNYNNTQARASAVYSYLPNGLNAIDGAMLASATDDSEHSIENSSVQKFNTGAWNALDNPDGAWGNLWNGIRAANLFLEKSDEVEMDYLRLDPNESQQEIYKIRLANIKRWKYEVRVLRAYFYSELIIRYGGVPVVTKSYGLNDNYLSRKRNSLETCVEFITDECDEAADNLPEVYASGDLGRVTAGAALALKSRVLLYAASDLWNDELWCDGYDHTELVTVDASVATQAERWADAAAAAHDVMKLTDSGYRLASDWPGIFRSYTSPEIIFARRDGNSNWFESTNFPVGFDGGNGGANPTQELVDAFEMADGSKFTWGGVSEEGPYENRDPRLQWTVLTNNAAFKNRTVEAWTGGRDGKGVTQATKTGYYLRKYVDENINLTLGQSSIHTWIIIRYAEILLNYAEAMNEAYGPDNAHGYGMTAVQAVNEIRRRAGMPNLPSSLTKDGLRERIRNERRVELAFEGHRFWDVRRWMIAEETLGTPVHGVEISKRGGTFQYKSVEVEDRTFDTRMYFYPIPQSEINITGWPQNPMW